MGERGPKAVNADSLRRYAYAWAIALYRVRDGQPGLLAKVVRSGPWQSVITPVMEWNLFMLIVPEAGAGFPMRDDGGEVVVVGTVAPEMVKRARQFAENKKGWIFIPPMPPRPQIWERLSKARSISDIQKFLARLHNQNHLISLDQWKALRLCAQELLSATQLKNYPKSDRPKSDDKRIQFWAKVNSGVMHGLAPETTIKRLAHFSLPTSQELSRRWEEYSTRLLLVRRKDKHK